jgi:hypothetical protein
MCAFILQYEHQRKRSVHVLTQARKWLRRRLARARSRPGLQSPVDNSDARKALFLVVLFLSSTETIQINILMHSCIYMHQDQSPAPRDTNPTRSAGPQLLPSLLHACRYGRDQALPIPGGMPSLLYCATGCAQPRHVSLSALSSLTSSTCHLLTSPSPASPANGRSWHSHHPYTAGDDRPR